MYRMSSLSYKLSASSAETHTVPRCAAQTQLRTLHQNKQPAAPLVTLSVFTVTVTLFGQTAH